VESAAHRARARAIADRVDALMFVWADAGQTRGYYGGYNTSTQQQIVNRVYQLAWPLWSGGTANATLAAAAAAELLQGDMWTPFGVRSTSSGDARYSNDNIINPYSEWRGPVWVNVNAVLAHSLRARGLANAAAELAANVVHTLAEDLRATGTWHEAYHSETGAGLAAPGFLSWDTLGATLERDVAFGVDPFALEP
jgi:neutral trehalase